VYWPRVARPFSRKVDYAVILVLWTIAAKSIVADNERNSITENGVRPTARGIARSLAFLE
jgi:hypothetical protein